MSCLEIKNDICLELGCGKGKFIENIAKENMDKKFCCCGFEG